MIPLTNIQEQDSCPQCGSESQAHDWLLPGFLALAVYTCPNCDTQFYSELPVGQTVNQHHKFVPLSGEVVGPSTAFATWFRGRVDDEIKLEVEAYKPAKMIVFLNCIDFLYGHALLKLLNAQAHLDRHSGFGLVVLVPRFLKWLVPDGVSEVWTTDLSLTDARGWHDGAARAIREELERFDEVWLSKSFSHPRPEDVDIERFTRVRPFAKTVWGTPPEDAVVTFIWREDRLWLPPSWRSRSRRAVPRIVRGAPTHLRHAQIAQVIELGQELREAFPRLTYNVVGVGDPFDAPAWLSQSVTRNVNEDVERAWCETYASSHVVVGVHGSNMLLPSAHAGSVVELVPEDRWGNVVQDLVISRLHVREALRTYLHVPTSTSTEECAVIVRTLLESHDGSLAQLGPDAAKHD